MPLDKQFISAEIVQKNENTYILTVNYSYYWIFNYQVVKVADTLDEAKSMLIEERSHDHIKYTDSAGKVSPIKK
jgi:hypothetical protein